MADDSKNDDQDPNKKEIKNVLKFDPKKRKKISKKSIDDQGIDQGPPPKFDFNLDEAGNIVISNHEFDLQNGIFVIDYHPPGDQSGYFSYDISGKNGVESDDFFSTFMMLDAEYTILSEEYMKLHEILVEKELEHNFEISKKDEEIESLKHIIDQFKKGE